MEMNAYQAAARETAIFPPSQGVVYTTLGLAGEAGEVADKVKKVICDGGGDFFKDPKIAEDIKRELGDVLWYVAVLSAELGHSLDEVASLNIEKLAARSQKGKLGGSGDYR